jgi:parvulin-like peptidyl-prolyl isomerase
MISTMKLFCTVLRITQAFVLLWFTTTCVASQESEKDPVLAIVNGHPIKQSYIYSQIDGMPLGDQISVREQLDRFIESIIREEILFQSVLKSKFKDDPELRDEVKSLVIKLLIDHQVTTQINVSEQVVKDYYVKNSSSIRGEYIRASQILMEKLGDCKALMKTIDSQEEFESAVGNRSIDKISVARKGDIGLFMNHDGPLQFEAQFFEMQTGEMRVFESAAGCHLVRITERVTPPLPPLKDVEVRIREILYTEQERALLGELLERSERNLKVERRKLKQNP